MDPPQVSTPMDIEEVQIANRYLTLPPTFLDFHTDPSQIRKNQRSILIDWMNSVSAFYKISDFAFFTAIQILDNYFSKSNVEKDSLQVIGCACLFIGEKFHDINCHISQAADYMWVTNNSITRRQLLDAETEVLKKLNFDIWFSTLITDYSEYKFHNPLPPYRDWFIRQTLEYCLFSVDMYKFTVPRLLEAVLYLSSQWNPLCSTRTLARSHYPLVVDYQEEIDFIFTILMKMQNSTLKETRKSFEKQVPRTEGWVFPRFTL